MKKNKIFTIGGATMDLFIKTSDHLLMSLNQASGHEKKLCFRYPGKVKVDSVQETFGGGACNTAVAFSKMGFEAHFVGMVGAHDHQKLCGYLTESGVNTHYVKKTSKEKTGFSAILSSYEGDRTVLAYSGANQYFSAKDLPFESLKTADWIFLNHLAKKGTKIPYQLAEFLKKNKKIKLAWNPGSEQIQKGATECKDILKSTEILFLNKEEAEQFSRKPILTAEKRRWDSTSKSFLKKQILPADVDEVAEIMLELHRCGAKKVVVTDGRNGAHAFDGEWFYYCPALAPERVDTLGAGDAFASGFVSGYVLSGSLKTALKYGTLNANSTVQICGAQNGLLDLDQMNRKLKSIDISVLRSKIYFL